MRPVIRVVITKTEQVIYVDAMVDMTAAVTSAARAHPPALAPVPEPQLPKVGDLSVPDAATQPGTPVP